MMSVAVCSKPLVMHDVAEKVDTFLRVAAARQSDVLLLVPWPAGMVSVLAHEITEAASDPLINAWYDSKGNENADKCAWNFPSAYLDSAGKIYNTRDVNNRGWLLQTNWHPYKGACTMTA